MARTSNQSGLLDIVIDDDEELSRIVQEVWQTIPMAVRNRNSQKKIRDILIDRHSEVINSHRDGEHSGYIAVGGIRLQVKNTPREPSEETKTVKVSKGITWTPFKFQEVKAEA